MAVIIKPCSPFKVADVSEEYAASVFRMEGKFHEEST
jgi:hypothetical protein